MSQFANALRAVLAWFGAAFGTQVAISTAQWIAWRAFILFVVMTLFPIMLTNWIYGLVGVVMEIVSRHAGGGGVSGINVVLTGLAGCVGAKLKLPESAALVMSAIMFRIGLQMIPGVGLAR